MKQLMRSHNWRNPNSCLRICQLIVNRNISGGGQLNDAKYYDDIYIKTKEKFECEYFTIAEYY